MAQKEESEENIETPKLDEFQLASLISDKVLFYIIEKLREGPIERNSMLKLIKAKFRTLKKKPQEYFELLISNNFIREYQFMKEKPNPDGSPRVFPSINVGESKAFFLLIKDFYAIRKPPVEILEKIEETEIPHNQIKAFRKELERYFKEYTNRKISGDDQDVIDVFMDQKMLAAITYLSEKIYKLKELNQEIKSQWKGEPTKIFEKLEKKNFVQIINIPEKNEKYVVLKTAIELQPIFPEYLIRNINQAMAEKKLDKEYAILTLNYLKKFYLEFEKPDMLAKYLKKVGQAREKLQPFLDQIKNNETPDQKKVNKIYAQIISIYNDIGDVEAIKSVEEEQEKIQQQMLNKL